MDYEQIADLQRNMMRTMNKRVECIYLGHQEFQALKASTTPHLVEYKKIRGVESLFAGGIPVFEVNAESHYRIVEQDA